MPRATKLKQPIMTPDEERFMAFEGVLQWAQAVPWQAERLAEVVARVSDPVLDLKQRHRIILSIQTECHLFSVSAHQLIVYRKWASSFGLFSSVDFSEVNRLAIHVDELRNMREHVIDYFKGTGRILPRWKHETSEYAADASSLIGNLIGGRLDWKLFAAAVQRIEPLLWSEPIPYPPIAGTVVGGAHGPG